MDPRTQQEFADFARAATLLLGQREGIEFHGVRAAAGNPHATLVNVKGPQADTATALAEKVFLLLRGLKQRHPRMTAIRFRNQLFVPTLQNDQVVGMHVVPEAGIVSIEEGSAGGTSRP